MWAGMQGSQVLQLQRWEEKEAEGWKWRAQPSGASSPESSVDPPGTWCNTVWPEMTAMLGRSINVIFVFLTQKLPEAFCRL